MKINRLLALALVAQFASPLAFADPDMRRRGRQGGRNGQIIDDGDGLQRRSQEDRLNCDQFNSNGRRGRRDQTGELQAQFCEYMSNKTALEDAWIDIDVAEEDLRGARRALDAARSNQRQAQSDKAAAQRVIESLTRSIPRLISEKQTQEANLATYQASVSSINANITAKQNEIRPLQTTYNQKLAQQNNYYSNTYEATKTRYERVVGQKQNKENQLTAARGALRTRTGQMTAIERALPGLNAAVSRAQSYVDAQVVSTRRRIERGRYENQTGYNLLTTHAQTMVREMRTMAGPAAAAPTPTRTRPRNRGELIRNRVTNTSPNFFRYRNSSRTRVEVYEARQTPAYRASRRVLRSTLDIDADHVQRLEAKMVELILAEKAVAQKEQEKQDTQTAIDNANAQIASLPGEISTLTNRINSLAPTYNSQKSQYEGYVAQANTAKAALDRANAQLATLRSNLATATRNVSQANSSISNLAGQITAQQRQKAQEEAKKTDAQGRIDASEGTIATRATAVSNIENTIEQKSQLSQRLIQRLREGSIVETYDRNLGVASTHIFVGAFPNALNFNDNSYDEDREYRGRNRYRSRNFRNARYGNSIRATYERAKRNGERIYLWGDLSDSYAISRLSDETGVYGTYYPRQHRRGLVDIVVETKSSDRALVLASDREERLTFLDLDEEIAVPVIKAERLDRRGRVIDNGHVLMTASLKDTGAVVFTSGISISDLATTRLQRILDKINRAPVTDFEVERADTGVGTGPATPGQIVNEASAVASGENTMNDRQNPVVEKTLPIRIGQGRIVKEIQVDVKMSYSYIGDISIKLKSPQGHVIILRDREGRSGRDVDSTYTITTQDLMMSVQDNLDSRSGPTSRSISREYTAGQATDGEWSVIVEDVLPTHGDAGTLEHIEIKVIAE